MERLFNERKANVADFLKEYLLEREFNSVSVFDENENMETKVKLDFDPEFDDDDLETGQIRLLNGTKRTTYIVLLKRWEDDSFVVMPFSAYPAPATQEEFKMEFEGEQGRYSRVLQVWNTRTLQDETIKKSWLVGALPEKDLNNAWLCWEASLGGKPLEDALLKCTGLPIYHADDPRLDYKHEELENFARVDAEDMAVMNRHIFVLWENPKEVALAAATQDKGIRLDFHVKGKDASVHVEYSNSEGKFYVSVFDSEGNYSHVIDGCHLVDMTQGKELGTIQDCSLECSFARGKECHLLFTDPDGNELSGEWKEQ